MPEDRSKSTGGRTRAPARPICGFTTASRSSSSSRQRLDRASLRTAPPGGVARRAGACADRLCPDGDARIPRRASSRRGRLIRGAWPLPTRCGTRGGVVLRSVYLAWGCLDLPFTLSFELDLVHAWVRAPRSASLADRGFKAVVVLTGHGPLDLNHLLKRACTEAESDDPGLSAYALCWLELNAARLTEPEPGEPTVVDHAARIETSWMLALEPDSCGSTGSPTIRRQNSVGIYGRNPRFTSRRTSANADQGGGGAPSRPRAGCSLANGETRWPTCAPSLSTAGRTPMLHGRAGPSRAFCRKPRPSITLSLGAPGRARRLAA